MSPQTLPALRPRVDGVGSQAQADPSAAQDVLLDLSSFVATSYTQAPSAFSKTTTVRSIVLNGTAASEGVFESKLIIPLYVIIFLLAVIGNSLVLITLVQNKRMRTVTNVYLLNLVSNLLQLVGVKFVARGNVGLKFVRRQLFANLGIMYKVRLLNNEVITEVFINLLGLNKFEQNCFNFYQQKKFGLLLSSFADKN